jgi:8-oxo-dGTP pyrophosphatase MutT (NUDIX family)
MGSEAVRAAGGVVWRPDATGIEVVVIHRPRYDDWSLPKGKLHPGEDDEAAALREVEEETGLRCELGPELPSTRYRDPRGRPKVVRFWAMRPLGGSLAPSPPETDEARWLPLAEAAALLTHEHEREVLAACGARGGGAG